jgi:hypothetical protein
MSLAYVSRRCDDCTSFVRLASGRIRLVYVEDAPEIPWYIESVPTVVLETMGDDGRPAYDLYSGDDAFALLEPRQKPKQESSAHSGPSAHPGPPGQKAHSSQSGPSDRSDHSTLSGPCAIGGNDGAVFECVGSEDGMSCGAFEALVPLGTDDDRRRTESTMAEWERAVAEERARSEKKETSKLERDFEQMKKERGN